MLLPSRVEGHHATREVQQVLWNALSGTDAPRGNTLLWCTSNAPDLLDPALRSRLDASLTVNPFASYAAHVAYFARLAPQLPDTVRDALAERSHAAGLSGRELEHVTKAARASGTPPITPELQRALASGDERAYASRLQDASRVSAASIERHLAAQIAYRRTRGS